MSLIYSGLSGHVAPEPSQELEERIRPILKNLDELLDIKWINPAIYNTTYDRAEGRYAITCRWPQADRRWTIEHYGEPYDILCWACTDLSNASSIPLKPEEVENRVLDFLYRCDNTRESWKVRMAQTIENNKRVKRGLKDQVLDHAHDEFGYYHKKIAHEHFVPVHDGTKSMDKDENIKTKGQTVASKAEFLPIHEDTNSILIRPKKETK